jgi:chromate transporter
LETPITKTRPYPLAALFTDWLLVGLQSFGGGSSTFILIHQLAMKRAWLTEEEFARSWALVQLAPGINLVKMTMLLGHRLRGWPGLLAAASGLLLPSGIATAAMTAGFAVIRSVHWVQAIMKGVMPAALGLSFAMAFQMARPAFTRAYREGWGRLGAHVFILASAALLMGVVKLSPVAILFLSGGAAILLFLLIPARAAPAPPEEGQ